jgi:hypothetical protein
MSAGRQGKSVRALLDRFEESLFRLSRVCDASPGRPKDGITTAYRSDGIFGVPWCVVPNGGIYPSGVPNPPPANVGQNRAELAPFRPNALDALLLDLGLKGGIDAFQRA